MSTDGLLPAKLSYVSAGRHVPIIATILVCIIIAILGTFFDIKVRANQCNRTSLFVHFEDLIGFADISALLSYTGVSVGLLIERYNHHNSYQIVLNKEDNDDEEELFELNNREENSQEPAIANQLSSDPFFTRLVRSIFRSCLSSIDSYFSPKKTAIFLLLIFIPNTSLLATMIIYIFNRTRPLHIILLVLSLSINLLIIFLFCLLRPKKHSEILLFTCPGIPLIPLININIFIFLMVFQDVHDWFAYICIIFLALLIYFPYSYWHSKSR